MYYLLNKTLITIPYKHPDPFALCDIVVIEFPDDYIEIAGIDNRRPLDGLVNSDLKELYCGLHGVQVTELTRFDLIKGILQFVEEAPISDIGKYHVQYQAQALSPYRSTRNRFVVGSYAGDPAPVPQPNRQFLARGPQPGTPAGGNTGAAVNVLAAPESAAAAMSRPWELHGKVEVTTTMQPQPRRPWE